MLPHLIPESLELVQNAFALEAVTVREPENVEE